MAVLDSPGIFTIDNLATLAGITRRTADEWQQRGILRASIQTGRKGRKALYSFDDVFAAHLAASLRQAGVSLATIIKAITLYYETPLDQARHYLSLSGDDVSIITTAEAQKLAERGVEVPGINLLNAELALKATITKQLQAIAAREAN